MAAPFAAITDSHRNRGSRPNDGEQDENIPEFLILGRIGKVREVGQTTRVSICANYAFKDRNGETKDKPYWNEITIWSDSPRNTSATMRAPVISL